MTDNIFAKIVSTPTLNSWSQAYNAGGLFITLSLSREEANEDESLALLGKEILNTLEAEYFSLEEKKLKTIEQAVKASFEKVTKETRLDFALVSVVENILYAFTEGKSRIILKRGEKTGTVITESDELKSASGYLEDKDLIILETEKFSKIVTDKTLLASLNSSPTEIAEALSPEIHGTEDGGAAAIIIGYRKKEVTVPEAHEESIGGAIEKQEIATEKIKRKIKLPKISLAFLNGKFKNPIKLNSTRKIILGVVFLIIAILLFGIHSTIKKQGDQKIKLLFEESYNPAQKKFEEGENLLSLNKNLARDDFLAAQKLLNESKSKFKPGSKEEQQISDLLKKVEENLASASEVNLVDAKEVDKNQSLLLASEIKNSDYNYFYSSDNKIYIGNDKEIAIDSKTIVKKDNNWASIGGLGVYLGNVYVLDKKEGILKFASGSYSKSSYLSSDISPDFSKASSIAIDGSIYVLSTDGSIAKFLKGRLEDFKISGLDTSISSPTRIYTNADFDNVYILDNGNSRIVVLNKDGAYQAQYKAGIIKNAKDFEVLEKDKKIFILSGNKIYQINLK